MSWTMRLIFLSIITLISVGMHSYVVSRFLGPTDLSDGARKVIWTIAIAHAVALPWLFQLMAYTGRLWADVLQAAGWVVVGLLSLLFIFTAARDVALWVALKGVALADGGPVDPSRRAALAQMLNACVALAAGGIAGVGWLQARRTAAVKRVKVAVAGLPEALKGFTIAQISDLHVGPTVREAEMAAVTEAVNALNPDLIAVTGDLVDGPVETLASMVAPLRALRAPQGVFFITGNHEYYSGAEAWCAHCAGPLGWRVLLNEHVVLEEGGARIGLAGVTDLTAGRMLPSHESDVEGASRGMAPVDLKILLSHQPARAEEAAAQGYHLQLSGHTHGGQYFPFTWLIRLAQRYVVGLHRVGAMWLYVNPGTTYWGPPIRVGAAQEITLIELAQA